MERSSNPERNHRLRQERIARNWRQRDLAEQLGTTEVTVKHWERGSQQPGPYSQVKLSTLFGKSAEELGLVEEDPSAPMTEVEVSEPGVVWMVPYMRNPHFTGRDELLEQLAQALSLQQPGDATMLRERQGARLDAWLAQVETQEVSELKNFARGLRKDYDAVKAELTQVWSQGAVEGHTHRLKLLKRQSYGQAGFQMLRKRVLRCC